MANPKKKGKTTPPQNHPETRTTPQGLGVHYTPLEEKQNRLDARRYCAPDMRLSLGGMVCPTTCGVAGTMTRVIAVAVGTPHHVWGSCRRVDPEMVESGGPHLL